MFRALEENAAYWMLVLDARMLLEMKWIMSGYKSRCRWAQNDKYYTYIAKQEFIKEKEDTKATKLETKQQLEE